MRASLSLVWQRLWRFAGASGASARSGVTDAPAEGAAPPSGTDGARSSVRRPARASAFGAGTIPPRSRRGRRLPERSAARPAGDADARCGADLFGGYRAIRGPAVREGARSGGSCLPEPSSARARPCLCPATAPGRGAPRARIQSRPGPVRCGQPGGSATMAVKRASATGKPSTAATPSKREMLRRVCSMRTSRWRRQPGSTGRRNFASSIETK